MSNDALLQDLGWRPFFQSQVDPDSELAPARVLSVHRGRIVVMTAGENNPSTSAPGQLDLVLPSATGFCSIPRALR